MPENSKEQTEVELREMLSKVSHIIRKSDTYFTIISSLIRQAENEGLFDNVKIGFGDNN